MLVFVIFLVLLLLICMLVLTLKLHSSPGILGRIFQQLASYVEDCYRIRLCNTNIIGRQKMLLYKIECI